MAFMAAVVEVHEKRFEWAVNTGSGLLIGR